MNESVQRATYEDINVNLNVVNNHEDALKSG
jgi:hypothetical protein